MPRFAFEMISKAYTRRKNFYNGFPRQLQAEIIRRFSGRKFQAAANGSALADWKQFK